MIHSFPSKTFEFSYFLCFNIIFEFGAHFLCVSLFKTHSSIFTLRLSLSFDGINCFVLFYNGEKTRASLKFLSVSKYNLKYRNMNVILLMFKVLAFITLNVENAIFFRNSWHNKLLLLRLVFDNWLIKKICKWLIAHIIFIMLCNSYIQ